MSHIQRATTDHPPGALASLGRFQIGSLPEEEWSMCLDCETTFPHLGGGPPSCNGTRIGRCPWCSEDSEPWKNGRGI